MLYALGAVQVSAAPYLLTLLIAFAGCVLVLVVATLLDSDADTALVRAAQFGRLWRTRMPRMLKRRQVDVWAYARSLSLPALKEQIAVCERCGLEDLCDRALRSRAPGARSTFSFCPNRPAIQRHVLHRAY